MNALKVPLMSSRGASVAPSSAAAPSTAAPPSTADSDEHWECRGFAPKPLSNGFQHGHGQVIDFNNTNPANQTWASAATIAANGLQLKKRRRLLQAIVASAIVMTVEAAGGGFAHSLALMSDATHMLADISSYCIALIAVEASLLTDGAAAERAGALDGCGPKEAVRQRIARRASFGLHRVEVLGSLGSILVIWLTAGVLLYEGLSRLVSTAAEGQAPPVDGPAMVVVATLGLVFNGLTLLLFQDLAHGHGSGGHGHSHGAAPGAPPDATARAAMLHAIGDLVQSVGMLVTAALIALAGDGWAVLDPLVTCGCAGYMLWGTFTLLQEAFLVLIEAAPPEVDAHAVREMLRKRPDVLQIRDFHVWALAPGKVMLSACVLTTADCEDTDDVLMDLQAVCRYKFDLHHCTFQVSSDPKLV